MIAAAIASVSARLAGVEQMCQTEVRQIAVKEKTIEELDAKIATHEGAIRLAQACVDSQTDLKSNFELGITAFQQAVFDSRFEFKFEEVVDAKTKVLKGLTPTGYKDKEPFSVKIGGGGMGGGMQSVCGIAWDLLTQATFDTAPFICFDEPATFMEKKRWPALMQMIKEYARESGMTIWIITNEPIDGFDQTVNVTMPGSHSVVEVL